MDSFEHWYDRLKEIAAKHGESVADEDAWRGDFDQDMSPEDSFYGEYPEHQ
ncbi:hypothetical protein ACSEE7_12490 [Halomonas cupida]|uniref:hypothetical protein n=1 Tax=Halomonas cupida TaxID=44933 RepID=UPI003EF9DAB0